MKTVNYFYDLSDIPREKGIEKGMTGKEEGPISAEFLGIIKYNGDGEDYLITRTTKAYNDDPNYIGKITARRVLAYESFDNITILIDVTEDENTNTVENQFKDKEHPEVTFKNLINKNYDNIIEDKDILTVTAINKKAFETKKMLVGNNPMITSEISKTY